jgi:hypothetical protein
MQNLIFWLLYRLYQSKQATVMHEHGFSIFVRFQSLASSVIHFISIFKFGSDHRATDFFSPENALASFYRGKHTPVNKQKNA